VIITAINQTYLKKTTDQASALPDNQKVLINAGETYAVKTFTEIAESAHTKVDLEYSAGTWYIHTPHWNFELQQTLTPARSTDLKRMDDKLSKYFTVGEYLRYDPRRIPTGADSKAVITRALLLGEHLDKIREAWGSPIIITSGYRPTNINAQVGGVSNSRHILGDAVDIAPQTGSIHAFQTWLDKRWYGALGWGASKGFVHIDMRNSKGFDTGGSKGPRWNY
jgi:putative chitinase